MAAPRYAYVSLVTSDDYAIGALVLAHSLRDNGTRADLVCLVTDAVSGLWRGRLADVYSSLRPVSVFRSKDHDNLALLGRPELDITFTKLHVWNLVDYEKIVFLDADTLPLQNVDELFQREELSAASDAGWPDCFNSGVLVLKPSTQTFRNLVYFADANGSFDGGDQGLLNSYFSNWSITPGLRLPFTYNVTANATYSYLPAYKHFQGDVKIVHFTGLAKPWTFGRFSDGSLVPKPGVPDSTVALVRKWWAIHDKHVGRWEAVKAAPNPSSFGSQAPTASSVYRPDSYSSFSSPSNSSFYGYTPSNYSGPSSGLAGYRANWNEAELRKKPIVSPTTTPKAPFGKPVDPDDEDDDE